ncbi:MAG: hypothetical protein AB1714_21090 [Acidobacteriota bacterium]
MKLATIALPSALSCLLAAAVWAAPGVSPGSAGASQRLTRPSDLEVVSCRLGKVKLQWSDNSSNEAGFRVYRGDVLEVSPGPNVHEAEVSPPRGERVTYSVKAFDAQGESLRSNLVEVTLPERQEKEDTLSAGRLVLDERTLTVSVSYGYYSQNGPRVLLRMSLLDAEGRRLPWFFGAPAVIDRTKGAEGMVELTLKHVGWFSAESDRLRLELLKLGDDSAKDPADGKTRPELQLFLTEDIVRAPLQRTWVPADVIKSVRLKPAGLANAVDLDVSYCWSPKAGEVARIAADVLDAQGAPLPMRGEPLKATACSAAGGLLNGTLHLSFAGEHDRTSAELRVRLLNLRGDILAERVMPCAYTWPADALAITGFGRTGINRIGLSGLYNFNSHTSARLMFMPIDPSTKAPAPDRGILNRVASGGPGPRGTDTSNLLERGRGRFDWQLSYDGWRTFTSSQLRCVLADADPAALAKLNTQKQDASILDLTFFQLERPLKLNWHSTLFGTITCLDCGTCCRSWVYQDGSVVRDGEFCINVKPIVSLRRSNTFQPINGHTGFNLKLRSDAACRSFLSGLNSEKRERSGLTSAVAPGDLVNLSLAEAVPPPLTSGGAGWIEHWITTDRFHLEYFSTPVLTVQAIYADRPLPRARVSVHGKTNAGEAVVRSGTTDAGGEVLFYEYQTSGWKPDVTVDVEGPAGSDQMDAAQRAMLAELSFSNVAGTPAHLGGDEQILVADLTPPYYVGEIRSVTFFDDEDPWGLDEVFFVAGAKPGKREKDRPQGLMWPLQSDSEYSWYEANGGTTISVNAPLFAFLPAQIQDKIYLGLAGMDNDVMPAIIRDLTTLFTKLGSLVATAFGQVELAAAIQAAGELIDSMLAQAEAEKVEKLGRWTREIERAELDRLVSSAQPTSDGEGNVRVELGLSRQKTPPLTRKVKVVLQDVHVAESGDWGDGEVRVFTRVCDRPAPRPDPARPGESISPCEMQTISLGDTHDGRRVTLNKTIFESDRLGPYLYIELGAWDKDEPDLGDDNDLLGQMSVTLSASENYGIGSTIVLSDDAPSGGPVTARLLITDQ